MIIIAEDRSFYVNVDQLSSFRYTISYSSNLRFMNKGKVPPRRVHVDFVSLGSRIQRYTLEDCIPQQEQWKPPSIITLLIMIGIGSLG